ncbi:MAG: hypothetical protein FWE36_01865 [Erysipelotrichales bacterium]|nr:hypothetical protein [Erysipelotrichales bacterium]
MELIYASSFTPVQQSILNGFAFWAIFTVLTYAGLRAFDKIYKEKYFDENIYKLKITKYFFSYYEIKTGEITKPIFWLNLVAHFLIISSLISNIAYVFNQESFIRLSRVILIIIFVIFMILIGIIGQLYMLKLKKTIRKF